MSRKNVKLVSQKFRSATVTKEAIKALGSFLTELARLQPTAVNTTRPLTTIPHSDPNELAQFLKELIPLGNSARQQGDLINVWTIAGLGEVELRNASVLAWLFSANSSHGRGASIFQAFMKRLKQHHEGPFPNVGQFPISSDITGHYFVYKEKTYPDSTESRVDIVVDGTDFIVILEVKINAPEGDEQMRKYLELAEAKAGAVGKQYCVIFLSRERASDLSSTVSLNANRLLTATWADVAKAIEDVVKAGANFSDLVLKQFAAHVRGF
jgi:hypothetical protein